MLRARWMCWACLSEPVDEAIAVLTACSKAWLLMEVGPAHSPYSSSPSIAWCQCTEVPDVEESNCGCTQEEKQDED